MLGGGYYAYDTFLTAPDSPAPAPKAKAPTATAAAPAAGAPGTKSAGGPTPSDTLNKIAQTPANAINKAQEAIAARNASGQTRVDVGDGQDPAGRPAGAAPKSASRIEKSSATTTLAPGVTATTEIQATADASPAFRAFVNNAKIASVVWGAVPARAFINGRLVRAGETIDPTLGVKFDGVNVENKEILFKDRTGATVARRY